MITENFQQLVLKQSPPNARYQWATVTSESPLRIRLDGMQSPLPFTPDSLVPALTLNERVLVLLTPNSNPRFKGRRVVIQGRYNG